MHRPTASRFPKAYLLIAAAMLLWQLSAWAFQPFTVRSIRTEGLQRLDLGTVLTYLPVSVGDTMDNGMAQQAIRALYTSGLFENVTLEREGDALIVKVHERPQIAEFKVEGNKKIGKEQLDKALKQVGLTKGALFKRDLLDQLTQELREQYYANGYYNVLMKTDVTPLPNNRVSVHIQIGEGKPATIRAIHIVGNVAFKESTLLDQMHLKPKNWWNPLQSSDHYSRQVLVGDLEALNSYYMNRGYLKFSIPSVQVALTPDMQHIYITINVDEGPIYKVSGFSFTGNTIFNTAFLDKLVSTHKGQTFSLKEATDTGDRVESTLADIGYAFAKVTPRPRVNEEAREVGIDYDVDPGKRVYVRHITFSGYGNTRDTTFRREMRQLEAAPFSKAAVERSRIRIARLPFVKGVTVDTKPVPGTNDEVDVNYDISQRQPGTFQIGVGYSGFDGFLINAAITHTNFLGTGDTVSLNAQTSAIGKAVSLGYTDPFFTQDGISQSVNVFYSHSKGVFLGNDSDFTTNTLGGNLMYGIPLSEFTTFNIGGGVNRTSVVLFPDFSSTQITDFVAQNGSSFTDYSLKTGISRDTRNRTFFATRGMLDSLSLSITGPGSDLTYYTVDLNHLQYIPLTHGFFLRFNGKVDYIHQYGSTQEVPPWENFFAGGPGTVRGFKAGYLGPPDSNGLPFGGTFRTTAQTELVLPIPLISDNVTTRTSVFFDVGNVFAQPSDFSVGQLRASAGVDFKWFTPIVGVVDISLGYPVIEKQGDHRQLFQFTLGSAFGEN